MQVNKNAQYLIVLIIEEKREWFLYNILRPTTMKEEEEAEKKMNSQKTGSHIATIYVCHHNQQNIHNILLVRLAFIDGLFLLFSFLFSFSFYFLVCIDVVFV